MGGSVFNSDQPCTYTSNDLKPQSNASPFTILFSNVTAWGPRILPFLSSEGSSIQSVVEHHIPIQKLPSLKKDALDLGRDFYGTAAAPSSKSSAGTSAGVAIMPKRRYAVHFNQSAFHEALGIVDADTARWYPLSCRLRHVTVNYIVVYLFCSEGLSDRNMDILHQIYLYMAMVPGPYIIAGDFQMHPSELAASVWFSSVRLQFAIPQGLTATCAGAGGTASLIDYFLISPSIAPVSFVEPVFDVPWKPHIGLKISLYSCPRIVLAPSTSAPRALPPLPLCEGAHELDSERWEQACEFSDYYLSYKTRTGILNLSVEDANMLHPVQLELGQRFAVACVRMEAYTCLVSGISPAPAALSPYVGRGQFRRVRLRPIVHRSFYSHKFRCPHASFWARLETCFNWIATFEQSATNLINNINNIKSIVVNVAFHWSPRAAPNCPAHAWVKWAAELTKEGVVNGSLGYSIERITTWKARATAQKQFYLKAAAGQARLRFKKWLSESLKKNVGAVHSFVKSVQSPFIHSSCIQPHFQPWCDAWAAQWGAPSQPSASCVDWAPWPQQLSSMVRNISLVDSDLYLNENVPTTFTVHGVREAAKAYPSRKKLGSDFIATSNLSDLPDQVLAPFASLYNVIHHNGVWPPQLLLNLFALIPKLTSGSRAIAKTPIFYRIWCILRSPAIKQWARDTCPDWDYAAAGRNALTAAATHQWVNELAHASQQIAASTLWDIMKYFDSIDWDDVNRVAVQLDYPQKDLKLALAMHAAPRILHMAGADSMVMLPTRSILQGCFHSFFIARMVMHFPILRIYREQREEGYRRPATTHTFVDDVSQFNIGPARSVIRTLAHAGVSLVGSFRALGLSISDKSVVLSTNRAVAATISRVIHTYTSHKLPVRAAARDLGVLHSTANVRRTSILTTRVKKSVARMKRIAPLAKKVRGARVLTRTGAIPQALWGHQALGVAPRTLKDLRTAAASASGIGGAGRCASTAIALSLGPSKDPAVMIAEQQVSFYFQLFKSDSTLRALTVRHWESLLRPLISDEAQPVMWSRAYGPVTGTIATLLQYKWKLPSALAWTDPQGNLWEADVNMHQGLLQPFLTAVRKSVLDYIWTNAALFRNGRGLDKGVDWFGTLALRSHLVKQESTPNDLSTPEGEVPPELLHADAHTWPDNPVRWLELFLCGGYWSNSRFAELDPQRSFSCHRCGAECEDDMHLIWECPANQGISSPHIAASDYLLPQARIGAASHPCLWLRGLLPMSVLPCNTPAVEHDEYSFVGQPPCSGAWPAGLYYADASGGRFSSLPALRRCGIGVCKLKDDVIFNNDLNHAEQLLAWGLFAPLPGQVHTVVRGELYAILVIARLVMPNVPLEIASDSKVNIDLYLSGYHSCMSTTNADLWDELFTLIEAKDLDLHLRWVKGHCVTVEAAIRYGMSIRDIAGNCVADALAGRAADFYEAVPQDCLDVQWYYALARKIQARGIAILSSVIPHRASLALQRTPVPRPPSTPLGVAVLASRHKFTFFGRSARCYVCFECAPLMRSHLIDWLQSPCRVDVAIANAFFSGRERPARLPSHRPVPIGRQVAHPSHHLFVMRGLVFCNSCGYYASRRMQNLAEPCNGCDDRVAITRVRNLRQGKLPSGLLQWPNCQSNSELSLA